MRKTLTFDDDLAGILQTKAGQSGHSFKQVVNDALRAGLAAEGVGAPSPPSVTVAAEPPMIELGYDADKLNQLLDEVAAEWLARSPSGAS